MRTAPLAPALALVVMVATPSAAAPAAAPPAPAAPPPAAAPDHVAAWDQAWAAARACMVGAPPRAPDPGDAYSIVELDQGGHHCGPLFAHAAAIARAGDADAGLHLAWKHVGDALDRLALDGYSDTTGDGALEARNGQQTLEQQVGGDLAAIDDADRALHAGARRPPAAAPPAPAVVVETHDPHVVVATAAWLGHATSAPREHQLGAWVELRDSTSVTMQLRGPDRIDTSDAHTSAAYAATWGAEPNAAQTAIATGALAGAGELAPRPQVVMRGKNLTVAGVFEHDRDRAIVVQALGDDMHGLVWILRSHDGGAHWGKPAPLAEGRRAHLEELEPAPELMLSWAAGAASSRWQMVSATGDVSAPRDLQGLSADDACASGGVLWYRAGGASTLRISDADGDRELAADGGHVAACGAERAIVETHDGDRVCDRHGCGAATKARGWVDFDARGQVVSAAQIGTIVRVAAGGGPARYVRVDGKLFAVLVWDDHPYLAIAAPAGVELEEVP